MNAHRHRIVPPLLGAVAVASMLGCAALGTSDAGDARATGGRLPLRTTPATFVYSPYKYVPVALDPGSAIMATAITGPVTPLVSAARSALPPGVRALTLAFATGECGAETWDGVDARRFAAANLPAFDRAGIDYIISTGGEAGVFGCETDAGMETFIARYATPRLIGFDFDIERGQPDAMVGALVRRIKAAKERYPALRFSFTLATWAATDGSEASLNGDGDRVMRAIADAGLTDYYVNLMVMNYGEAIPRNCIVSGTVCDMGRSAMQAARNLNSRYGVPLDRIELTPMIGVNDVRANVFTLADAQALTRDVRAGGLGGVHFWSLDRDTSCAGNAAIVSGACSGLPDTPGFAFTRAFLDGLAR